MNKIAILLTACINPNGMSKTILQDKEIRKRQYEDALNFYLANTTVPIVLVENTNYELSHKYDNQIKEGRLEYITFNGNDYDKSKGKGFGEALILLYAINNSEIIKRTKYIIKITGRIIIPEINKLIKSPLYKLNNLFRCDFVGHNFTRTVILISTPQTIFSIFSKRFNEITETTPLLFEHIVYQELIKKKDIQIIPFF